MLYIIHVAFFLLLCRSGVCWSLVITPDNKINVDFGDQNCSFEGAVSFSARTRTGLRKCSGSLVKFENQPDTDFALVLTNGHCYEGGFLGPGQILFNQPSTQWFNIITKSYYSPISSTGCDDTVRLIGSQKVLYATMTKTDVALYQLTETYQEIFNRTDTTPFILSNKQAAQGTDIEVISGPWRQRYSCAIDGFVYKLIVGNTTYDSSIRYTNTCPTIEGTSGSPIVKKGTRTVVGINSLSSGNGKACTIDNACEQNEQGNISHVVDARYGQQTYWFYSCLENDFSINLEKEGCLLPR